MLIRFEELLAAKEYDKRDSLYGSPDELKRLVRGVPSNIAHEESRKVSAFRSPRRDTPHGAELNQSNSERAETNRDNAMSYSIRADRYSALPKEM